MLTEYLQNLIRFKTFAGNNFSKEVSALYAYVVQNLPKAYKYKMFTSEGIENMVIYKNAINEANLVLHAHVDVVAGKNSQFNPLIINNKIYGRGASDMKFALASYLEILKTYEKQDKNFNMWLTGDEELGGFNGTNYLVNSKGLSGKVCFSPDGDNDHTIITKAKGVLHFRLTSTGVSAHAATPWEGKNAITQLIRALDQIRDLKFFAKNPNLDHWVNTFNIGKISGGKATNSVADSAFANCDTRFVDNKTKAEFMLQLKKIVKNNHLQLKYLVKGDAFAVDEQGTTMKAFTQILQSHQIPYKFAVDYGSSDARFFAQHNIPVIIYKPICGGDHTDKEWIDMDSLQQFTTVLTEYIDLTC